MNIDSSQPQPRRRKKSARRTLALIAAGLLGAIFAFVVSVVVLALNGQDSLPPVTEQQLHAATSRWKNSNILNYDIEVRLSVRHVEMHTVQVRDGIVTSYQRNGEPMSGRRTFDTWSVPGMLETVERDVNNVASFSADEADQSTPQLGLWGSFNARYGYPERYRRIQYKRWGTNVVVSWEVIRFEAYDASRMDETLPKLSSS